MLFLDLTTIHDVDVPSSASCRTICDIEPAHAASGIPYPIVYSIFNIFQKPFRGTALPMSICGISPRANRWIHRQS